MSTSPVAWLLLLYVWRIHWINKRKRVERVMAQAICPADIHFEISNRWWDNRPLTYFWKYFWKFVLVPNSGIKFRWKSISPLVPCCFLSLWACYVPNFTANSHVYIDTGVWGDVVSISSTSTTRTIVIHDVLIIRVFVTNQRIDVELLPRFSL